jgi:hypothetical protein
MSIFKKKTKTLPLQYNYPSGTCIKTESGYYYIKNSTKHPIRNQRILDSWYFKIVAASDQAVKNLITGRELGFRDGSLIRDMKTGTIYLISEGKKRNVTTPDFFDIMGFDHDDMIWAAHAEVELHKDGVDIV